MTKRSQRRPVRYDQSGCMWSFISILDFRHASRSNRKLIADKRRSKCTVGAEESDNKLKLSTSVPESQGTTDGEGYTKTVADAAKPSVKALIEEEMVTEQGTDVKIDDAIRGFKQQESGQDGRKKKNRSKRNSRESFDIDHQSLNAAESLNSECPYHHKANQGLENKHNVDDIMEEFCNQIYERSMTCVKHSDNKEKLREVIKEFISQELTSGKHLTENGGVNFPQELVNVLQIPNLDEESFLKHLGDPNSLLLKYVQSLQDAHLSNKDDKVKEPEEVVTSKQRKFFRRNIKNQETGKLSKENEGSQAANRIVILKPGPAELTTTARKCGIDSSPDSCEASQSPRVSSNRQAERSSSHFFLMEIKRRWKHVIGKDQAEMTPHNPIAKREQNLKKGEKLIGGENLGKKSPSKDHFYIEKIARPKREEKLVKLNEAEAYIGSDSANSSKRRVPNIYIEARKHLSEMLSNGNEEADSSGRRSPKTLARILSLSEFSSPLPSPGREWERSFITTPTRLSSHKQTEKNEGSESKHAGGNDKGTETEPKIATNPDIEVETPEITPGVSDKPLATNEGEENSFAETPGTKPGVSDKLLATRDDMSPGGTVEHLRTIEIIEEENSITDTTCGLTSSFRVDCGETNHSSETLDQDGHIEQMKEEVHHDDESPPSLLESPPRSSIIKKTEDLERAADKHERASPVSVLEPLFIEEEDISPARTTSLSAELPIQPLQIKFEDDDISSAVKPNFSKPCMEVEEETLVAYVKALLQACGLNWDELYLKSQSSDQLLDPSLFDMVDFFCDHHTEYDHKLVFDCINEVLLEVCGRYFGCCPCVSFAKKPMVRPIPNMENAVSEVWEGVHWHLVHLPPLPRTLDQVVRKDLSRNGSWMDLRVDTETIGAEMGDDILDDLIEDTVTTCTLSAITATSSTGTDENFNTVD